MRRLGLVVATIVGLCALGPVPAPGEEAAPKRADRKEPPRTEFGALLIAPRTADRLAPKAGNGSSSRIRPQASSWGTTLGGLAIVVALILIVAKVVRKHVPAGPGLLPAEALQILGRRNLEQRHTIHLVRCGARILIVGASQQGLNTLAEITDPVEVDYLAGLCRQSGQDAAGSFGQLFKRFQPEATPGDAPDDTVNAAADLASQRLKHRLHQAADPGSPGIASALHALESVHG